MIPIVSLANLLNALVAFIITARIFNIQKQLPKESSHSLVTFFVAFFFCFGVMWFFYGMPGVFVNSLSSITVAHFFADIMAYVSVLVGLRITFFVLNQPVGTYLSSMFVLVLAIIYVVGRLKFFPLHHIETFGPYIYYTPTVEPTLQALTGVASSFGSIVFAGAFFSIFKRQRENKLIAKPALYLSVGMLCMFFASTIFFILVTPSFWAASLASVFSLVGFFLLQRGIPFKGELEGWDSSGTTTTVS